MQELEESMIQNNSERSEKISTTKGDKSQEITHNTPEKLDKYKIYPLSILLRMKYIFAGLVINRATDINALNRKIKSIKTAKGIISPCLITSAKKCLDAGLKVKLEDGSIVTKDTPNLDMILVKIDGEHRDRAIKEINRNLKPGEKMYENYYYLPLNDDVEIIDLLRESNVATKPWAGSDFLTNLILSLPEANTEMLKWVQMRQSDSSDAAAWLWATLDKSRIYTKTKIIKATTDISILKEVTKDTKFESGKRIYNAMTDRFDKKIVGLKPFPQWVISKISDLVTNISEREAIDRIITFSKAITRAEAEAIEQIKGTGKDQKIKDALEDLYNAKINDK